MIDWEKHKFNEVVNIVGEYTVLDLSKGHWVAPKTEFSVGKYDELRPGMYNLSLIHI